MSANFSWATLTIPSLSGTFSIRTRLALSPKMPKEPSSPSRSKSRTERQCINEQINNIIEQGQRTTAGIVHRLWRATGDRNVSRELLSFIAKTVRYNAYDTIPAKRCRYCRREQQLNFLL